MKLFPDYQRATNAAYKVLANMKGFSFSTDVFAIVQRLPNCRILAYGQAAMLYGVHHSLLIQNSEYGFSIVKNGRRIILYNENMPFSCIRFTIAHEIGHAVLEHEDENNTFAEKEANCFARNLLCPIPVVESFNLESPSDYVSLFNVSESMANVSWSYRSSDHYYISQEFYSFIEDRATAYMLGFDSVWSYYKAISA